jgi:NTE family protein
MERPFVLSGGGCRCVAQLGAIKALNEHNIYPSEISGTSGGAMVGAFLANGLTPEQIKDLLKNNLSIHILAWNGFKEGLASMKNIEAFLKDHLRLKKFEDLPTKLYVTATNFETGMQHIFSKGDLIKALLAANSIPVIFPPTSIDNVPYVDGGLSDNLPVEPFIDRKNEVVSIYVNPIRDFTPNETYTEIVDRSLNIAFRGKVDRSAAGCFLYIEPPELNKFGLFDIHKISEIFEIGYTYTKELLKVPVSLMNHT